MKRLLLAFGVLVILLTGCGDLHDAAAAKKECHELDGTFRMWMIETGSYEWECNLSDEINP